MRRLLVAMAAVGTLAAFTAGCTGAPPSGPPTTTSSSPVPPRELELEPRLRQACDEARMVINDATARFTARLADAVAAGERGDTAARDRAIADIRAVFVDWAAKLRALSDRVDSRLKTVLVEYAVAADAVIARVRTAEDLDKLSTFDGAELDTVASRLADVCH